MFQFRRFPTYTYLIQCTLHGYCPCGLPHSEICGLQDICSSPQLIAACHVLRRLLMPRHSPCALFSLTCSSQSPFRFLPAFGENSAPFPCSSLPIETRFAGLSIGFGTKNPFLCNDCQRKLVLLRIMQAPKIVEIVIVTLAPFRMLFHN